MSRLLRTSKIEPNFQRLHTALFGGQPDRVPLCELAIDPLLKEKFLGKSMVDVKAEIEFSQKAGYDYIRLAPGIDFNPANIPPKEGFRTSPKWERDEQRSWHSEGKGVITSIEEFEKYQWPKLEAVDYSVFEQAQRWLPDDMKIVGQYGDIFTWTWDLMGFETFSFALIENPELVKLVFEKVGTIVYSLFETMASFDDIGALWYSDDIAFNSGLFCSPEVFRTYLFPWMKKIGNLCKEKGIPYIYHSDGKLWEVMDDLLDCGINALQPIEPKAMDIREVKERYGQRICLIGNVDVDLLVRGSPNEIENKVRELINHLAPGGGYCLGSGNTVPNYVPVENFKAMVDTALQYGGYPID